MDDERTTNETPQRRTDLRIPLSTIVKVALAVLVVFVVVKLWLAFLLFLVAVLLAVTLYPSVRRVENLGVGRPVAVLVVALLCAAAITAVVLVVLPPLAQEVGAIVRDYDGIRDRIERDFPPDAPVMKRVVMEALALPESPQVRAWFARPLSWGLALVEIVSGGIVVLMLALYLLVDGNRLYAWLLSYVPRRHRRRVASTVPEVKDVVRAYVRGQFITCALCGAYTYVVLSVLGVPAALPLAVAAFVLDVIPVLGTVAMTAPATLLALTVSPATAALVLAALLLYHFIENYLIAPRVYGRNLRLSTLSVMLALIVGGLLQGILGAVLILPVVAAYPIIERIWLSKYLGPDVVTDHTALAATVGTAQERAVEKKVRRGEPVDPSALPGAASLPPDGGASHGVDS